VELRPGIDPGIAAVIERCLAKEPAQRPLAGEIAQALSGSASAGAGSSVGSARAAVGASGRGADDAPSGGARRANDRTVPAAERGERGALGELFAELRRRHVYRVLVAYGAVAITVLGLSDVVFDAFEVSQATFQLVVTVVLGGFPVAALLSWLYDVRRGHIERTRSPRASARMRMLAWTALILTIALSMLIGWWILGPE
jgi:hypothetical protein